MGCLLAVSDRESAGGYVLSLSGVRYLMVFVLLTRKGNVMSESVCKSRAPARLRHCARGLCLGRVEARVRSGRAGECVGTRESVTGGHRLERNIAPNQTRCVRRTETEEGRNSHQSFSAIAFDRNEIER